MPFLLEVALGGVAFSLLASLAKVAGDSQKPKTPYDRWLAEVKETTIVKDRS